jgi:5'-deoxy-5'-methylthioadenosine phosphorylase
MRQLAFIGGTGLSQLPDCHIIKQDVLNTPYGAPSAPLVRAEFHQHEVIFLARHGNPHTIAPHKINYRANIWALKQLGVTDIIAVAAVGGITPRMTPAHIALPDQVIDYSYGREHTFFTGESEPVQHIDFTFPYHPELRNALLTAADGVGIAVSRRATYGCTQGPRLESIAEIARMERDGCDIVGMTTMPEAALAKELELAYASVAVIANWAAGKAEGEITMQDIEHNLHIGMANAALLLKAFVERV